MTPSFAVVIAATDVLPAFKQRAGVTDAELLAFSDTDVLRALEAITARKPRLVALERVFAATPRGAALINRIKADPSLVQTEIRVLAHDSDYSRVLPRAATATAGAPAGRPASEAPAPSPEPEVRVKADAATARESAAETERGLQPELPAAAPAATLEPPHLDQRGTRRALRIKIKAGLEVLVDGNSATLIDLSSVGAQVISPTILRPNQRVRISMPGDGGAIRLNATIAWAEFELPPQYRAGIEFVDADDAAIEAFANRHRA